MTAAWNKVWPASPREAGHTGSLLRSAQTRGVEVFGCSIFAQETMVATCANPLWEGVPL